MSKKLDKMVTKKKTVGSSELAQLQQEPELPGRSICAINRSISRWPIELRHVVAGCTLPVPTVEKSLQSMFLVLFESPDQ